MKALPEDHNERQEERAGDNKPSLTTGQFTTRPDTMKDMVERVSNYTKAEGKGVATSVTQSTTR